MERVVQTADGRVLAVEEAGDPDGRPVLVHGGTPNSRHLTLTQNHLGEVHTWLGGHL